MSMLPPKHANAPSPIRPLVLTWSEKRPSEDEIFKGLVFSEETGGLFAQSMDEAEKFEGTDSHAADTKWTF